MHISQSDILISIEHTVCILGNQQFFACVESYELRGVRSLCALLVQVLFYKASNCLGYPTSTYSIQGDRSVTARRNTRMYLSSATPPVPSVEPAERLIQCLTERSIQRLRYLRGATKFAWQRRPLGIVSRPRCDDVLLPLSIGGVVTPKEATHFTTERSRFKLTVFIHSRVHVPCYFCTVFA